MHHPPFVNICNSIILHVGTCVIALGGRFNADEFSITYGIGGEFFGHTLLRVEWKFFILLMRVVSSFSLARYLCNVFRGAG